MSTAQDVLKNSVNTKPGEVCFFIIMHQILDKFCNNQSVAKVYELKSQPSYALRTIFYLEK